MSDVPEITVCICTYKREELLLNLLDKLRNLSNGGGLFSFRVHVIDNDSNQSAKKNVQNLSLNYPVTLEYFSEPRTNIALARNKCVETTSGEYLAFIDDDEFPCENWLESLFKTQNNYNADAALGPVIPHFTSEPKKWLLESGVFDRPDYSTGTELHWRQTRSGNVLIKKSAALRAGNPPFREEFGITFGEDVDFFRRLHGTGARFVWCSEARAWEITPPERSTLKYFTRRYFSKGAAAAKSVENSSFIQKSALVLKDQVASAGCLLLSVVILPARKSLSAKLFIKMYYHLGRLYGVLFRRYVVAFDR